MIAAVSAWVWLCGLANGYPLFAGLRAAIGESG
jgi:hypothetical protein